MYKTGNENDYSFLLELDEFGNSDFRDVNAIKKSESSLSSDSKFASTKEKTKEI